jgi:hypothetical protein
MSAEEFREWVESFVEVPDTWSFTKGHAHLLVGDANVPLTLSTAQLASLSDNEQFPRHRELRLVPIVALPYRHSLSFGCVAGGRWMARCFPASLQGW